MCQLSQNLPFPAMGGDLEFLGKPAMRTRWVDSAIPHKAGDVETNAGPTTTQKQVWICDIRYK